MPLFAILRRLPRSREISLASPVVDGAVVANADDGADATPEAAIMMLAVVFVFIRLRAISASVLHSLDSGEQAPSVYGLQDRAVHPGRFQADRTVVSCSRREYASTTAAFCASYSLPRVA